MKLPTKIRIILETNWLKTVWLNFYYFRFRDAIKFPILVSYRTILQSVRGGVEIRYPISTGMLLFGYRELGSIDTLFERSIWEVKGTIILNGRDMLIGRGTRLCVGGVLSLGNQFAVTGRSTIICHKKILFGNSCLISWDVQFMDTDFHKITDSEGLFLNEDKPIIVEDRVWIGCRTTILKGSKIPSGSIIAAGAVVSGNLEKGNCIYSSERKILKEGVSWQM